MAIWIKPSGLEIEINDSDASIEKALSLDWKLKGAEHKQDEPKKRGRPAKVENGNG